MLGQTELTDMEARFVEAICDAKNVSEASRIAGLPDPSYGRRLMRTPKILLAIEGEHRIRIATRGASAGLSRLYDTAEGVPSTGPMVDAAKVLIGLAGYVAPKAAEPRAAGDVLAEISLDELKAIIDKRESAAAASAKPVNAQVVAQDDANLLNLLD